MKFLRFDLYKFSKSPYHLQTPKAYMGSHYNVIHGFPQPVYNDWWFCVEDYNTSSPLPEFLEPMNPYNLSYWRDKCFENCREWQDNHSICYGGDRCKKGKVKNF